MLATIEKFQTPSLKELALAEMIQPPSVTRLVRSLEQQGMIAASSDEADRRSTRVQLTAKGKKELSEIRLRKTAYLEQHLSSFSAAELKRLTDLIEILEQLTEAP
jgi:DNA-binding MarR family transcriptional regulator